MPENMNIDSQTDSQEPNPAAQQWEGVGEAGDTFVVPATEQLGSTPEAAPEPESTPTPPEQLVGAPVESAQVEQVVESAPIQHEAENSAERETQLSFPELQDKLSDRIDDMEKEFGRTYPELRELINGSQNPTELANELLKDDPFQAAEWAAELEKAGAGINWTEITDEWMDGDPSTGTRNCLGIMHNLSSLKEAGANINTETLLQKVHESGFSCIAIDDIAEFEKAGVEVDWVDEVNRVLEGKRGGEFEFILEHFDELKEAGVNINATQFAQAWLKCENPSDVPRCQEKLVEAGVDEAWLDNEIEKSQNPAIKVLRQTKRYMGRVAGIFGKPEADYRVTSSK